MSSQQRRLIDPFHDQPERCWFCREQDSLQTSYLNALSKENLDLPDGSPAAICSACVVNLATMAELARTYNLIHRGSHDWSAAERLIQRAIRHECGSNRQKAAVADIILRVVRRACVAIAGATATPEPIRIELVGDGVLACVNLLQIAATTLGILCIPVTAADVISGAAWRALCHRAQGDAVFAGPAGLLVVIDGYAEGLEGECSMVGMKKDDYGIPGECETIYVD